MSSPEYGYLRDLNLLAGFISQPKFPFAFCQFLYLWKEAITGIYEFLC